MSNKPSFRIAVLPGDGIGPEVIASCLEVLEAVVKHVGGFSLDFQTHPAGAGVYRETGNALPATTMEAARAADAILLGAMGLPSVRYPDGTEISPQLDLRVELGLYAGVRPVRILPHLPWVLTDKSAPNVDYVLIRESTEGLFASHGKGTIIDDREARDTQVITRVASERVFDFAFALARKRTGRDHPSTVTCVDKANVFASFTFFRKIFDECATRYPDIVANHAYVDATTLFMVRRPWDLDVLVTENMFGDILSDLGAGLMGGMGFAPSADIGEKHAVFQPCHGSAPDIAGQGKANPIATFVSGAMMLDWLADNHDCDAPRHAANLIREAVDRALLSGDIHPMEVGGSAGTSEITETVLRFVRSLSLNEKAHP